MRNRFLIITLVLACSATAFANPTDELVAKVRQSKDYSQLLKLIEDSKIDVWTLDLDKILEAFQYELALHGQADISVELVRYFGDHGYPMSRAYSNADYFSRSRSPTYPAWLAEKIKQQHALGKEKLTELLRRIQSAPGQLSLKDVEQYRRSYAFREDIRNNIISAALAQPKIKLEVLDHLLQHFMPVDLSGLRMWNQQEALAIINLFVEYHPVDEAMWISIKPLLKRGEEKYGELVKKIYEQPEIQLCQLKDAIFEGNEAQIAALAPTFSEFQKELLAAALASPQWRSAISALVTQWPLAIAAVASYRSRSIDNFDQACLLQEKCLQHMPEPSSSHAYSLPVVSPAVFGAIHTEPTRKQPAAQPQPAPRCLADQESDSQTSATKELTHAHALQQLTPEKLQKFLAMGASAEIFVAQHRNPVEVLKNLLTLGLDPWTIDTARLLKALGYERVDLHERDTLKIALIRLLGEHGAPLSIKMEHEGFFAEYLRGEDFKNWLSNKIVEQKSVGARALVQLESSLARGDLITTQDLEAYIKRFALHVEDAPRVISIALGHPELPVEVFALMLKYQRPESLKNLATWPLADNYKALQVFQHFLELHQLSERDWLEIRPLFWHTLNQFERMLQELLLHHPAVVRERLQAAAVAGDADEIARLRPLLGDRLPDTALRAAVLSPKEALLNALIANASDANDAISVLLRERTFNRNQATHKNAADILQRIVLARVLKEGSQTIPVVSVDELQRLVQPARVNLIEAAARPSVLSSGASY